MRYAAEAPLKSITGDACTKLAGRSQMLEDIVELRKTQSELQAAIAKLDSQTGNQVVEHLQLMDEADAQGAAPGTAPGTACPYSYVVNELTGVYHRTLGVSLDCRPDSWKTYCGWRFGSKPHTLVNTLCTSRVLMCERCLPRAAFPSDSVVDCGAESE